MDFSSLWDFAQPAASEQRFRQALESASDDEAIILQTQIARSYGLRRDFATARSILRDLEPALANAHPEARIYHALESGRTHASGTHRPEELTPEALNAARAAYQQALDLAQKAMLDHLAIDAIHMFAFVDQAPADQVCHAEQALEIVNTSTQPEAQRWEASIRHNLGYALHQLGRYDAALEQFKLSAAIHERNGNASKRRIADWMVAWTLRAMGRIDEALELQLRLEREADDAGEPDPYVFEELEALYRHKGDQTRAEVYAAKRAAMATRNF